MKLVESAFVPDPSGALGLALCEDDDRRRWTYLVDGDYLHGVVELAGLGGGESFDLHSSRVAPVAKAGWPDEWSADDLPFLASVEADVRSHGWEHVRGVIVEAARRNAADPDDEEDGSA